MSTRKRKPVSIEMTIRGTWRFIEGGDEWYDRSACKRACIEYLALHKDDPPAVEIVEKGDVTDG